MLAHDKYMEVQRMIADIKTQLQTLERLIYEHTDTTPAKQGLLCLLDEVDKRKDTSDVETIVGESNTLETKNAWILEKLEVDFNTATAETVAYVFKSIATINSLKPGALEILKQMNERYTMDYFELDREQQKLTPQLVQLGLIMNSKSPRNQSGSVLSLTQSGYDLLQIAEKLQA